MPAGEYQFGLCLKCHHHQRTLSPLPQARWARRNARVYSCRPRLLVHVACHSRQFVRQGEKATIGSRSASHTIRLRLRTQGYSTGTSWARSCPKRTKHLGPVWSRRPTLNSGLAQSTHLTSASRPPSPKTFTHTPRKARNTLVHPAYLGERCGSHENGATPTHSSSFTFSTGRMPRQPHSGIHAQPRSETVHCTVATTSLRAVRNR